VRYRRAEGVAMSKLHIFDMDGTLLRGSACLDISRHLGQIEAVNDIEERWGRGEIDHVAFYELCLPLWEGLSEDDIDEVFAGSAWLDGVQDVWADIAARGERSAVITLSPQFFVDRLLKWGVSTAHGAVVQAGRQPEPELVTTPEAKVVIANDLMEKYGITADDCVAYGDSSSDIPLFEHLSNTVAVNGSETLRKVAAVEYHGSDIREAYALGRSLIEGEGPPERVRSGETAEGRP
jgi:phosphoserine phosphatase